MTTPQLVKAFTNPTQDSQVVFRQLLKAMSEPGTLVSLNTTEAIENLYASSFAVCLSLMDQQTPLWLSAHFGSQNIQHNLHFHSGVKLTQKPKEAEFALLKGSELDTLDDLTNSMSCSGDQGFSQGSSEYPETGCTLLIQVDAISEGQSEQSQQSDMVRLKLTGPGIETEKYLSVRYLPTGFLAYLSNESGARHSAFPLGLDFIFLDQNQLFCLPRTTIVEVI